MWAPHPAAFTIDVVDAGERRAFLLASFRAVPRCPLCAASAPQHVWSVGTTTRQPFLASTRIVATLHPPEPEVLHAAGQEGDRPADLARRLGDAGEPPRGRAAAWDQRSDASREEGARERSERARDAGSACVTAAPRRDRPIGGTERALERSGSICVRAASIIRPNGTCDGQTSSQARQTRQRSMNSANVSSVVARPSWTARIAVMRPRGDADSSPVSRYVGQWGRHRPHATQAFRSAWVGASPSAQFGSHARARGR